MSEVTPATLTAMIRAGDLDAEGLVPEVERYVARLPRAGAVLAELLPGLTGGQLALALFGLAAAGAEPAVLGLVNLHLPPSPPPGPATRALLEQESTHDTEAGRLARWLLAFPGRSERCVHS